MRPTAGEMPFLEHLEELRVRILRTLLALVAGFGAGLWLVDRFALIVLLKAPIAPFLPDGKLTVLSPTDPVMIVLKLAFVVGLVLASPILLWQLWAFLAPALYEKEKKAIVPALFAGFGLFLGGAAFAWAFIVPKALQVLLSFQPDAFNTMITYEAYFGFVMQIVLAMGLSSELPLLMIILAALGLATPATFGRFRRIAIVLSFVAGAFLSPGADIFSMLMMTVPLVLLYEVGIAGAVVIHRRQLRRATAAGAVLLALALPSARLEGQMVPLTAQRDTLPRQGPTRADSATAKRLGLPTAPSRQFSPPDSVVAALLDLPGYEYTRYLADTAVVFAIERRLRLAGHAMTERLGTVMEAEVIEYQEVRGDLIATGEPRLFDKGSILVGQRIRYDTREERGVVEEALTRFDEMGANWFVRGNLAADSSSRRLYAASGEITSCDLPTAHYHFATKQVKWMSKSMLIARPAVLYVRDVPVAWIPFIFQETKPGRRSGILVPQFGFNDIVRPSSGYSRQVTDAGYYWAPNDYLDAAARFDWYSGRYFRWSVTTQYKWLDRFVTGSFQYSSQQENTGAVANSIRWSHQQYFGITTSLAVNLNLTSNSSVISNNALDPLLNTQQLSSDINLSRRFSWGQVTLGGRRRQTLGDDQVSQSLPSLTITPAPIDIGSSITWSPTFAMTNDLSIQPRRYLVIPQMGGAVDSIAIQPEQRLTTMNLDTPFRFGSFNWRNALSLSDG
ncbi:MAG TPA: twin-arginine translocase subunit TatC, partial [Gemmatimonadales bacterium]